jgi:hypothetical protein
MPKNNSWKNQPLLKTKRKTPTPKKVLTLMINPNSVPWLIRMYQPSSQYRDQRRRKILRHQNPHQSRKTSSVHLLYRLSLNDQVQVLGRHIRAILCQKTTNVDLNHPSHRDQPRDPSLVITMPPKVVRLPLSPVTLIIRTLDFLLTLWWDTPMDYTPMPPPLL